jgi:hypothetical protein
MQAQKRPVSFVRGIWQKNKQKALYTLPVSSAEIIELCTNYGNIFTD